MCGVTHQTLTSYYNCQCHKVVRWDGKHRSAKLFYESASRVLPPSLNQNMAFRSICSLNYPIQFGVKLTLIPQHEWIVWRQRSLFNAIQCAFQFPVCIDQEMWKDVPVRRRFSSKRSQNSFNPIFFNKEYCSWRLYDSVHGWYDILACQEA